MGMLMKGIGFETSDLNTHFRVPIPLDWAGIILITLRQDKHWLMKSGKVRKGL